MSVNMLQDCFLLTLDCFAMIIQAGLCHCQRGEVKKSIASVFFHFNVCSSNRRYCTTNAEAGIAQVFGLGIAQVFELGIALVLSEQVLHKYLN